MVAQVKINSALSNPPVYVRRKERVPQQPPLPLSKEESKTLEKSENLIAEHLATFFEVAAALMEIRDLRLYRADFTTFEIYCRKRWQLNRSHAYRMLDAAHVTKALSPMGDTPLPQNERQVRPLSGLAPSLAKKAWKLALEKSGQEQPTGETVKQAVEEITKKCDRTERAELEESWQKLVEPLLREGLIQTKKGQRDKVQELLNKAILRLEIGRPREDI